jgi:hypothetical protein
VYCSPPRQQRILRAAARLGALSLVSTPDLLEAVPGAIHLPVTIDVERWAGLRRQAGEAGAGAPFVILHAPSDPEIKGTAHVDSAVRELGRRRPAIEYLKVQGVPAEEAGRRFTAATVAVDQLHMGWHGLFAVEAMALGKPVLTYIRPELRGYKQDLPVVPTRSDTLARDLERLHDDPGERRRLAAAGIEYAAREHGLRRVAADLKRLYESQVRGGRAA